MFSYPQMSRITSFCCCACYSCFSNQQNVPSHFWINVLIALRDVLLVNSVYILISFNVLLDGVTSYLISSSFSLYICPLVY